MITLDTSGIFALLAADDPDHDRCAAVVRDDGGPLVVPVALLGEAGYMIERYLPPAALRAFLDDLGTDQYVLDCGDADMGRIRELVERYDDLRLGFADAAVAACAERNAGRVLTLDRRDFDVLSRELDLEVLPQ